ncbi:MAG: hypothetical protein Q4E61_00280, partial [Alphaproteobacteria bacterium]|nr:hypothetical protein [Alphaproteobacteria bacterium]
GKVYSSDGIDNSIMSEIKNAALPEFPQTTAIKENALKFIPRPGESEFQLWRGSDVEVNMISYERSNFSGLESRYSYDGSDKTDYWDSSSSKLNGMYTGYITISDMQTKYMVMDGTKFYTPLTRFDLFLTKDSIFGSCYYLKDSIYYILDENTIAWYKQGTSEPSVDRDDWTLTDEAYNAAIDDLGLVLQLKK